MTHHICTGGCQTVSHSEAESVCEVITCGNLGKPLESCSCVDDKHSGKLGTNKAEPIASDEDEAEPMKASA